MVNGIQHNLQQIDNKLKNPVTREKPTTSDDSTISDYFRKPNPPPQNLSTAGSRMLHDRRESTLLAPNPFLGHGFNPIADIEFATGNTKTGDTLAAGNVKTGDTLAAANVRTGDTLA